jgi:hypothetical protein
MLPKEERKENRTAGGKVLLYTYFLLPHRDTKTQNPKPYRTKLKYLEPLGNPYYKCDS